MIIFGRLLKYGILKKHFFWFFLFKNFPSIHSIKRISLKNLLQSISVNQLKPLQSPFENSEKCRDMKVYKIWTEHQNPSYKKWSHVLIKHFAFTFNSYICFAIFQCYSNWLIFNFLKYLKAEKRGKSESSNLRVASKMFFMSTYLLCKATYSLSLYLCLKGLWMLI